MDLSALADNDYVDVEFHKAENDGNEFTVGLNGKTYQVPKGKIVSLPMKVLRGCIDTATTKEYLSQSDGRGISHEPVLVKRFPYTVHGITDKKTKAKKLPDAKGTEPKGLDAGDAEGFKAEGK